MSWWAIVSFQFQGFLMADKLLNLEDSTDEGEPAVDKLNFLLKVSY